MRIPHVRMTTRMTTIAIAVVALMLGGSTAWQRHEHRREVRFYLQQAGDLDGLQRAFLTRGVAVERGDAVASYPGEPQGQAARVAWSRDQATRFAHDAQLFRRIAASPLLLEDPDLPKWVPAAGRARQAAIR